MYGIQQPGEGSKPQGVQINIWIKDPKKRNELAAKIERLYDDPRFTDEPWDCELGTSYCFWMEMNESDIPHVDAKLDQLFGYAIRFLKSVKGIAAYFKP